MTREKCIDDLRTSMGLFLFDPDKGTDKSPEELNDLDRMTYEAMKYAAEFLEARPERGTKKFFFTFGTDPRFPFGIGEFVEVRADTIEQAAQKFKAAFPCRPGSTLLNCAFFYGEEQWRPIWTESYGRKPPIVVID